MTVGKMVSQLAGGMFVSIQLFLVTLIFPASWHGGCFWADVEKSSASGSS